MIRFLLISILTLSASSTLAGEKPASVFGGTPAPATPLAAADLTHAQGDWLIQGLDFPTIADGFTSDQSAWLANGISVVVVLLAIAGGVKKLSGDRASDRRGLIEEAITAATAAMKDRHEITIGEQPVITRHADIYVQEPHFRAELGRVEGEMSELKTDMHNQLKEFRAYVHQQMHDQTGQNQILLSTLNLQKQQLNEAIGEVHDRVTGVLQTVTETKAMREANGVRLIEISTETTDNGKQIAKLSGLVEQALKKGFRT